MKIIIAPTKKQRTDSNLKWESEPLFFNESESLRDTMRQMTKQELQASLKTSDKLTAQVYSYYHNVQSTTPTASLYSGAVFNAAAFQSWNELDIHYAQDKIIILSALYGPLRLLDKVKPYRLDFFTKVGFNLYDYWDEKMKNFNNDLKAPIINLASKEFSKMIRSDLLIDIKFLEINGKTQSTNAKIARGTMVQFIIKNRIENIEDLKKFNLLDYSYKKDQSSDKELVFAR